MSITNRRRSITARAQRGAFAPVVARNLSRGALMLGTALGVSISAYATFNAAPAFAADVPCAPDPSGSVANGSEVCTGAGDQVVYTANGDLTVTLNNVTTTGASVAGVDIDATGGAYDINVVDASTGALTGTFAGIRADGTGGDSSLNINLAGSTATVTGGVIGIDAFNQTGGGTGTVTVTTGGGLVSGLYGIYARSTGGANTVNVGTGGVAGGNYGVYAVSDSGTVIVTSTGAISASSGTGVLAYSGSGDVNVGGAGGLGGPITATGDGVYAGTNTGDITVRTGAGGDILAGGNGVYASSLGGAITIETGGTIGTAGTPVGGMGIYATVFSASTIDITAHDDIYAAGRGIFGFGDGGTVTITTTEGADITSGGDWGIRANTVTGDGDAVVLIDGSVTAAGGGVSAISFGTGSSTIHSDDAGDFITATAGDGLYAYSQGGDITITSAGAINAGSDGIYASTPGAGTVTVRSYNTITGASDGIVAYSATGAVDVFSAGAVEGTAGYGVYAHSNGGGDVTVNVNGATGALAGVDAFSNGGAVTVSSYGDVNSTTGDGIHVRNTTGDINIYTQAGDTITAIAGDGIDAATTDGNIFVESRADIVADPGILLVAAGSGNISVSSFGVITANNGGIVTSTQSGYNHVYAYNTIEGDADNDGVGDAIHATSNGGAVYVFTGGSAIVGNNQNGIYAANTGATADGVRVRVQDSIGTVGTPVDADGVDAFITNGGSTGNVTVLAYGAIFAGDDGIYGFNAGSGDVSIYTGAGGDITATTNGVRAVSVGAGDSDITVTTNGTINSGFHAIQAQQFNATSTGTITITANDAIVSPTRGISAINAGTGGILITTGANGDISGNALIGIYATAAGGALTVTHNGDIGVSGNPVTGDGVFASLTGGSGTLTVNGSGVIFAGDDGVDARASGIGSDIIVTASGAITATDDGVYALASSTGDSDVSVTINAVDIAGGDGVDARISNVANTGSIVINANLNVTGGVAGSGIQALNAGTSATSTNAITIATGRTVTGGAAGVTASSGSAVAGATTINNNGTLMTTPGALAVNVTNGATTINNNAAGIINGRVTLAAGAFADTVNNAGLWNAQGTSTFGLGTDTVNNTGRVEVAPTTVAATTVTWTGLEAFNNQGGVVDLRQGHVGDIFSMVGTTFTGSTVGPNLSRLQIDASLTGATTSDRLVIGAAAGQTTVQVTDIAAASAPALDFTGALVVDATAGTASNFILDGGVIDKGFVEYRLVFNGTTFDWLLQGLPSEEAFQFVKVGAAAQDFWNHSADTWTARMAEIRDAQGQAGPSRSDGSWEMWGQAHVGGQDQESNPSYTIGGTTFTPNLSTSSDWRGFQMGADKLAGNWLYGVTGGFIQQETTLDSNGNSFDIEGWNLGGYLGWTSGAFFVNALGKADWFSVDANTHSAPGIASFDGLTWGAKGEVGFRLGGPGLYLEPVADYAYSTTDLDDAVFSPVSTSFKFNDVTSSRGSIGARIGTTWGSIAPYVGVYAMKEFDGENSVTMLTGAGCPACMTIHDEAPGTYGRVDYGFTILNWGGLEGFVKGETLFSGDYSGTTVRLGARWRW